jgi:CheY-like chemotaxis protein
VRATGLTALPRRLGGRRRLARADAPRWLCGRLGVRRVLVIDDESDSRIVLRQYLEDLGCEVRTAGLGEEGLAQARAWRPDLITLDHRLPDMAGEEVLRQLSSDATLSATPVLVVSIVGAENRSRLPTAACVLDKLVSRESLRQVLGPRLRVG